MIGAEHLEQVHSCAGAYGFELGRGGSGEMINNGM